MNHGFGHESPSKHAQQSHRPVTRYLVVISSGGVPVARLLLDGRTPVAEFDASSEEVATMIKGLAPNRGASGAEWDQALAGHSAEERTEATVYTLDL